MKTIVALAVILSIVKGKTRHLLSHTKIALKATPLKMMQMMTNNDSKSVTALTITTTNHAYGHPIILLFLLTPFIATHLIPCSIVDVKRFRVKT
jgi:hypothetical protein